MLIFRSLDLERMLIWQKFFYEKVLFITQLSSHLIWTGVLNVEIWVQYRKIFVVLFFNVPVGLLRDSEKIVWFHYKTFPAIRSFFLTGQKQKNKQIFKIQHQFNFRQPVEMTWSTHKTKVNLLYGFVVFHEIIVCSTALFNIQRNSFPNKVHFSKSIVETVFFYAWENIATIMNFWITLLNDFFHDNRLHFIGIFTSTLRQRYTYRVL